MNRMKAFILVLAIFSAFSLIGTAAAAPVITFEPFNPTVTPGALNLSIVGQDFTDTTMGGGLSIAWDPGILTLASDSDVSFTFPDSAFTGVDLNTAAGTLDITVSGFFSGASGDFGIADLAFVASEPGSSFLNIEQRAGFPWKDETALGDLDPQPTYLGGTVNVVPIPSAIILLGGGLVSLFAIRRRA